MRNKKLIILFSVLLALTAIVVFNSVLFSVQHVNAYCINIKDEDCSESRENVLKNHKIRKGSSIFLVNESKVVKNIEAAVDNVRVIGIDRTFPNRVYIQYIEIKPYLKFVYGGQVYFCSNDMRIMSPPPDDEADKLITLRISSEASNLGVGETVKFESSSVNSTVAEIFYGLERLNYYDTVMDLFEEIDLTGSFVEITTRTGMEWRILSADDLAEKLRFALSVYNNELKDIQREAGTLIVTGTRSASYKGPSGDVGINR